MVDVYLLETLMRERQARVRREAVIEAVLRDLEQSRRRSRKALAGRLRRAVAAMRPIRRVERMASR